MKSLHLRFYSFSPVYKGHQWKYPNFIDTQKDATLATFLRKGGNTFALRGGGGAGRGGREGDDIVISVVIQIIWG